MTTNVQIIGDALRLLGVISEAESPSAEQGTHALRRLNQMMEEWDESGIKIGYFAQSSTTDTCPIPAWAERGVTSKLALDLRMTYPSGAPTPELFDDSLNGYGTIVRKVVVEGLKGANMDHMPRGSGTLGGGSLSYDIITDTSGGTTWA